jgi:hypothetical protein
MKKATTPVQTPSKDARHSHVDGGININSGTNPLADLLGATLSMSWQLALVVLIPIVGGFELDKKLHTLPILTIVGFVLAMAGMSLVVWHQLQLLAPLASSKHKEHHQ